MYFSMFYSSLEQHTVIKLTIYHGSDEKPSAHRPNLVHKVLSGVGQVKVPEKTCTFANGTNQIIGDHCSYTEGSCKSQLSAVPTSTMMVAA